MAISRSDVRGLDALLDECAFVDLSGYRKVRVGGSEALGWLNGLLAADLSPLAPGRSIRSLLLTPTGHIRADVAVVMLDDEVYLLQAPDQPEHVGLILSPFILSSDVTIHDATHEMALFSVPGRAADRVGHPGVSPSVLGEGVDLIAATGKPAWRVEDALVKADLQEASPQAVEAWRIRMGRPKMGTDFDQRSLPAEAGLEHTIGWGKGCFLGQEAVAKIRNLGHPRTILLHLRTEGSVRPGDPVVSGGVPAGRITSSASFDDVATCLAEIRWERSHMPLALPDGRTLDPVPKAA